MSDKNAQIRSIGVADSDAIRAQNERTAVLGQLAGGVAHDFNNMLQVITASAALIEEHPTNTALVRRCARRMIEAAERGAAISNRLLVFAKRNDDTQQPIGIDINVILESIRELLAPLLPANVNVQTKVESDLPLVLADQAQLETVLVNLATNARDAMINGGDLVFSANLTQIDTNEYGLKSGSYICLSVADTGIGMDAATIARVMEPFFSTKPPGRGTGLGLPLAKEFANGSGGALDIASVPNVSTEVRLWLPVALSVRESPNVVHLAARQHVSALHVLVIEDDELVRETMAASLEQAGFIPIEVADGETAIASLANATMNISAIVADYALPGISGVTVAQKYHETIPALLVTGNIGDVLIDSAYPKCKVLRKPFTPAQLVTAVSSLLLTKV